MSMSFELSEVKFKEGALDEMLNRPSGDVGKFMRKIGMEILTLAPRLTGRRTGRLAQSIQMSQGRAPLGQELRVFSNLSYAYLVHEGTRAHVIDPPGKRVMSFMVGGRRVYVTRVMHPGTRGKRYLAIPLRQVISRL